MASEHPTQPVSYEKEETTLSENEESSSDETTSTTCKFIFATV